MSEKSDLKRTPEYETMKARQLEALGPKKFLVKPGVQSRPLRAVLVFEGAGNKEESVEGELVVLLRELCCFGRGSLCFM